MSSSCRSRRLREPYVPFAHREISSRIDYTKLLAVILSWLLIYSMTACVKPKPLIRTIPVYSLRCLTEAPPNLREGVAAMAGGACPEGYACIEISAALALSEWHKAIVMWVQEAWSKCGPQPPATDITTKT